MPELLSCRLDGDGMRRQRDRYAALGRHVESAERGPRRLSVRFDARVDEALLAEAVAVERECCPFFGIAADRGSLVMTVEEAEHDPALDAIADALRV